MQQKGSYHPHERYERDQSVREVMDVLASNRSAPMSTVCSLDFESVHRGDRYFHIADFPAYVETQQVIGGDYLNEATWWRKGNSERCPHRQVFQRSHHSGVLARHLAHREIREKHPGPQTTCARCAPAKVKVRRSRPADVVPEPESKQVAD